MKPIISNHWNLFTAIIRLSNMIGELPFGSSLKLRNRYKIFEQVFFDITNKRRELIGYFTPTSGCFYEVVKYKGKDYYFKVDFKERTIEWTTEINGWDITLK